MRAYNFIFRLRTGPKHLGEQVVAGVFVARVDRQMAENSVFEIDLVVLHPNVGQAAVVQIAGGHPWS